MKRIKILAHRGYSGKYLENTLIAFEQAIMHQVDGIELDVQKTKDGYFVIIHDPFLNRISNCDGRVCEMTYAELKKIKLKHEDQKILELESFLKTMPGHILANIELKGQTILDSDCEKIYQIIKKYRNKDNVVITSFEENLLFFFKNTEFDIGLLIGTNHQRKGILKLIKILLNLDPQFINLPVNLFKIVGPLLGKITIFFFKLFRKKYMFWTVNTREQFYQIKKYADFIITNEVEFIKSLVETEN